VYIAFYLLCSLSNFLIFRFFHASNLLINKLALFPEIFDGKLMLYLFLCELLNDAGLFLEAIPQSVLVLLHLFDYYLAFDKTHSNVLVLVAEQVFSLQLIGVVGGELVGKNVDFLYERLLRHSEEVQLLC
jgi:hypothetical protein